MEYESRCIRLPVSSYPACCVYAKVTEERRVISSHLVECACMGIVTWAFRITQHTQTQWAEARAYNCFGMNFSYDSGTEADPGGSRRSRLLPSTLWRTLSK